MTRLHSSRISSPPFWDPDLYAQRRHFLDIRLHLIREIRHFFDSQGFREIETPILQNCPGMEVHIHPFTTHLDRGDGQSQRIFLHTSPELTCKKLLAAGETKIFTLAKTFRNREQSPLHLPEFTLLEWYRAHETYETLMQDCEALLHHISQRLSLSAFSCLGVTNEVTAGCEKITLSEAFQRYVQIDLTPHLPHEYTAGKEKAPPAWIKIARTLGMTITEDYTWSDIFSRILVEKIEPHLGRLPGKEQPVILYDYPLCEGALARAKPGHPTLAERFELYLCGIELANGFTELTDPHEQRARFIADQEARRTLYGEACPLDNDFLAALKNMPPAAGVALGVDRLVMMATNARTIQDVIFSPICP